MTMLRPSSDRSFGAIALLARIAFRHVAVGIGLGGLRSEQDHRALVAILADDLAGLAAVHVGEVHVEDDQVRMVGLDGLDSGGGGGGWGKWGGASAGVEGNNGSEWVSVQAGGESGSTTYFEVCVGPSSSSVDDCEDVSDDSDSKQS